MTSAQILTTQENIDLAINTIKRFSQLYAESDSLGEKEAFIDYIHSAQCDLVRNYGFTWSQVEQIA